MDYTRVLKGAIIATFLAILGWINFTWAKYATFGILIIAFYYMLIKITTLDKENQHYKTYCQHTNDENWKELAIIQIKQAPTPKKKTSTQGVKNNANQKSKPRTRHQQKL